MKIHLALLLVILLCMPRTVESQLSADDLRAAAQQQDCKAIRDVLDITPLLNDQMKFHAAVCHYRNGDIGRAFILFLEVRQNNGQLRHMAAFWESKIHALQGRDSLALDGLKSIPVRMLNKNMLSQPEFDNLANQSHEFVKLKSSVAPGFNIWTGILAMISGIGLLTTILLFFGKSRFSAGEKWLSVVVFAFVLILTAYLTMWTRYVIILPYLQNMWPFLTLLVGPSLYFYLKATFKEEFARKEILLHYSIPLASFLLTLPVILRDFGLHFSFSPDLRIIGASPTLLTGQLLYYAVRISLLTGNEWQVDANIKTWTKSVSLGMWVYTLAFFSYFILVQCSFFNPQWDYAVSLTMALGILGIAYMGLIQKRVFSSEPIGTFLPVQKYQSSSLTPAASESIRLKLERLLREEQVFKENELRLDDLAAYLDISRHQMSQVINEHYGVNFFELINKYRIEYVKRMLADPVSQQQTIIQIAYEAGFNNKASFNRYFKQETGLTPSAYRIKEHEEMIKCQP